MMKITSIKRQVKNAERVSIFVDGKYEFSLSLDELVKYKLRNGAELDEADIKKFKKISADGKLRARALEWLLNRPHSEREFRDYLYRKKAEKEQIEKLVNEFSSKGYLDNAKFAAWFVELQVRRNKSDRQIRAELFKKGISRELVDEVVGTEENDEISRLKNLVEKKSKLSRYQNDPQKLARYLVGQGFSWQLVKSEIFNNDLDK
ncbi:MAG TPA: RecX family transcriptional regulator [Candidatus Saccharimonadales bacterium]|nr:RecX family transcriptional regulator [Candidatus Saccharimonadales bacterium]